MSDDSEIFICSFCEKPIRFRSEQSGRRVKCPSCERTVVLFKNRDANIDQELSSTWYYRRMRLIRGLEDVGPVPDEELISLIQREHIDAGTPVMSPELTNGKWIDLGRVKLNVIQERIQQRSAERQRRYRLLEKRRKADADNREKLRRGIRSAVETGSISTGHRSAIEKFAVAAGIPAKDVEATITAESKQLVREVFEEAIEDGILEPREEQQLSQLALSLGVNLDFTKEDEKRIALCRLAYELDSGSFVPQSLGPVPFKTAVSEDVLGRAEVCWHEIVTLKRPAGIHLGGENYLKRIGEGTAFLTTKQVSMVGELQSKKFTLSSVQRVTRYCDGVLFNRSSGKSVFLEFSQDCETAGRFALIAEHACSGEPVLGRLPIRSFIPEVIDAEIVGGETSTSYDANETGLEPKYTFRVVGDFIGERESFIRRLRVGDPIFLIREPGNNYDSNAVAVFDSSRHQLGYLKRDVASWFAPLLDRKSDVKANVHTFTSAGSLIVGVYL